jgi:hypothetical protein
MQASTKLNGLPTLGTPAILKEFPHLYQEGSALARSLLAARTIVNATGLGCRVENNASVLIAETEDHMHIMIGHTLKTLEWKYNPWRLPLWLDLYCY